MKRLVLMSLVIGLAGCSGGTDEGQEQESKNRLAEVLFKNEKSTRPNETPAKSKAKTAAPSTKASPTNRTSPAPANAQPAQVRTSPNLNFVKRGLYGAVALRSSYSLLKPGTIVTVNSSSGKAAPVGLPSVSGDDPFGVTGLAFNSDGELFASVYSRANGGSARGVPPTLIEIDPDTGKLVRTIGEIRDHVGRSLVIRDLAMQPGTNVLFGIGGGKVVVEQSPDNTGSAKLYAIDTATAQATLLGDTGRSFGGAIAFAPSGTLYHCTFTGPLAPVRDRAPALITLDPASGKTLQFVPLEDPTSRANFLVPRGLAVRPDDGVVFLCTNYARTDDQPAEDLQNNLLATLDPDSGRVTPLASSVEDIRNRIGDVAFRPAKVVRLASETPSFVPQVASPLAPGPVPQVAVVPAAMPDLPHRALDLAYLPPDAEVIVSIEVAELWKAPLVKTLLAAAGPMAQQLDPLASRFGLAPEDLESVTFGATGVSEGFARGIELGQRFQAPGDVREKGPDRAKPNPDDASGMLIVVRTVEPYNREKILAAVPKSEAAMHTGKTYYRISGEQVPESSCVVFADAKTILLGNEGAIKAALARGQDTPPVRPELKSLSASHHVVAALVPKDRDAAGAMIGSSAGSLPGATRLGAALEKHGMGLGVSIHASDGLVAQFRLGCTNETGAAEVLGAMNDTLEELRKGIATLPPPLGQIATQILGSAHAEKSGSDVLVTVAVPSSVFDPETLAMAMLPLMMVGGGGFEGAAVGPDENGKATLRFDPLTHPGENPFGGGALGEPRSPSARPRRTGPTRIVVDATKGGASWWSPQKGPDFDPAKPHKGQSVSEYLQERDWQVQVLTGRDDVAEALESADVVIRYGNTQSHNPQQVAAYQRFVAEGGALLLLAGYRVSDRADPLAAAFGVEFGKAMRGGTLRYWNREHPVTRRLKSVSLGLGSEVTRFPASATILGRTSREENQGVVLGALEHGEGTVVFLGSELLLLKLPQPLSRHLFSLLAGDPIEGARRTRRNRLADRRAPGRRTSRRAQPGETESHGERAGPGIIGWTMDFDKLAIPDTSALGRVHGKRFQPDRAELQIGILTLRQGKDFFADLELTIFLFLDQGESVEGKTYQVRPQSHLSFGTPHVHLEWKESGKELPDRAQFGDHYVMRLEFGKARGRNLPGKIYVCLPDDEKSFVAGTFLIELPAGTRQ